MTPFPFLFEERIGDLIRGEGRWRICRVTALDQGQFHPLPIARVRRQIRLRQASAKNLRRHVFEFAPLLHGTHFHGAQEVIGDIEGRFHEPTFQLSSFLSNGQAFSAHRRGAARDSWSQPPKNPPPFVAGFFLQQKGIQGAFPSRHPLGQRLNPRRQIRWR
jgi:hypothetical protein